MWDGQVPLSLSPLLSIPRFGSLPEIFSLQYSLTRKDTSSLGKVPAQGGRRHLLLRNKE